MNAKASHVPLPGGNQQETRRKDKPRWGRFEGSARGDDASIEREEGVNKVEDAGGSEEAGGT